MKQTGCNLYAYGCEYIEMDAEDDQTFSRPPKIILKNAIKATEQIEPNQTKPAPKQRQLRTTPIDMKLEESKQRENGEVSLIWHLLM